jgi:hypothetical protein
MLCALTITPIIPVINTFQEVLVWSMLEAAARSASSAIQFGTTNTMVEERADRLISWRSTSDPIELSTQPM